MGLIQRSVSAVGIYSRDIGDIGNEIKALPETLSSFSKCMEKSYCKYPFIAGCIIGGLIILSCLWCLIRCCLCGAQCCACCCGGCGGRNRKEKHTEVHHHHGAPPGGPPGGFGGYSHTASPTFAQPPAYNEPPQYATYEVNRGGQVSADALPPMPTWQTQKVEVKQEEVELGYVNNDGHRRGLTPSPERAGGEPSGVAVSGFGYTRPELMSPGPVVGAGGVMHAPQPIAPTNGRMGFDPRGPTPGLRGGPSNPPLLPPAGPGYPEDNYGYPLSQPQQQQQLYQDPQYAQESGTITRWDSPAPQFQAQQQTGGGYQAYPTPAPAPQRQNSQRQGGDELFFGGAPSQNQQQQQENNNPYQQYQGQGGTQQYPGYADDYSHGQQYGHQHQEPNVAQRRQQEWTVL